MQFMKDFGKPTGVLTAICLVVAVALVSTYQVTEPIIGTNAKAAADAARAEVYVGETSFEEVGGELPDNCLEAYRAGSSGYVFTTTSKGYGGVMKVMTAISNDGTIVGVKIFEHSETPGLGSRAAEPDHLAQYLDQNGDVSGVTAIGGATISSNAVKRAVESALAAFQAIQK